MVVTDRPISARSLGCPVLFPPDLGPAPVERAGLARNRET